MAEKKKKWNSKGPGKRGIGGLFDVESEPSDLDNYDSGAINSVVEIKSEQKMQLIRIIRCLIGEFRLISRRTGHGEDILQECDFRQFQELF